MERNDDQPKWREDPIESFSDWKIEIISGNDDDDGEDTIVKTETYHVHRNFLAHGFRRSEYFSRLFRSEERFQENETNTSRIELDRLAAQAFPHLLDYVYGDDLTIKAKNATALHHLGEYFEIAQLKLESLEFCEEDMCLKNLHYYYIHAQQLNDEVVMDLVTDYLRAHIHAVRLKHAIVEQSDPQLWIDVLGLNESQKRIEMDDTRCLSKIIAKMCMNQSEEALDAEAFHTLTGMLTSIHPSVALDLCELDDRYCPDSDDDEDEGPPEGLSLLQERCAGALSATWTEFNVSAIDPTQAEKMMQRSPAFLFKLLVQSATEAWVEVGELSNQLADCKTKLAAARKDKAITSTAKGGVKRLRALTDPSDDDESSD